MKDGPFQNTCWKSMPFEERVRRKAAFDERVKSPENIAISKAESSVRRAHEKRAKTFSKLRQYIAERREKK